MKSTLTTVVLIAASIAIARSDNAADVHTSAAPIPAFSVSLLQTQAADFDNAVKARDVHTLHKIDHALAGETAEWQTNGPALPGSKRKQLNDALADLSKQAHRAHVDGHALKWDDATAAQQQFASDLKEIEALTSAGK